MEAKVADSTVKKLERQIARCQAIVERTSKILARPIETPSAAITGSSNRSRTLDKRLQREVDRQMKAGLEYQQAKSNLEFLQSRLANYQAGEVHANGQPRADAPSRLRKQQAKDLYADFMRSLLQVGQRVALVANPRNTVTIKRVNKSTVTTEMDVKWKFDELLPLNESGEPMDTDELRAAFRAWGK
jgi:hypothetical protein